MVVTTRTVARTPAVYRWRAPTTPTVPVTKAMSGTLPPRNTRAIVSTGLSALKMYNRNYSVTRANNQ